MAVRVQTRTCVKAATDLIDIATVLSETFDPKDLKGALNVLKSVGVFFGAAGIVLDVVSAFVPDHKHAAIMKEFTKVHEGIEDVRSDIKELGNTIKLEHVKTKYAGVENTICLAMGYCTQIGNKSNVANRETYEKRLKGLGNNQKLASAVDSLLDGMTAGPDSFDGNILKTVYEQTGGDRPKIMRMAGRLITLLLGGMTALMVYESLANGRKSALDLEQKIYEGRMEKVETSMSSVIEKCTLDYIINIEADIDRIIADEHSKSNNDIVQILKNKLKEKYDWLAVFCVVYNDMNGDDSHFMCGYHEQIIEKLHCHGKCVMLHAWPKNHISKASDELMTILRKTTESQLSFRNWWPFVDYADKRCNDNYEATKLSALHHGQASYDSYQTCVMCWWNKSCDLQYAFHGLDENMIVWVPGSKYTMCTLFAKFEKCTGECLQSHLCRAEILYKSRFAF